MTALAPSRAVTVSWPRGLAGLIALVLFALALRPAVHVYDMPMTEDGYYALAVARNLAAGHGLTIDGTHLTNGFQPLFTLLEAGAFVAAKGDEIVALRLVMALGWIFHVAGAALVALLARDAWPARRDGEKELRAWLAALLYLASPLMLNHAYNGLETACVMFFYAACARWMQRSRDRSWTGLAGFGALIGFMVLARIDAGFVAAALGVNELRRSAKRGLAVMLAHGMVLGGVALLVSSPWWLYNLVYFGSPMPTSGTAQQDWGLEWLRFEHAEWALRLVLMPWLFAGAHESDLALDVPIPFGPGYMTFTAIGFARTVLLLGIAALLWRAVRRSTVAADLAAAGGDERNATSRTREFAICFGLAYAALVLYYVLSFAAYWFYYRYFAPLALFAFVVAPILLARGALAVPLAVLLSAQSVVLTSLALFGVGLGGNTVYHDQVALVRQLVPESEVVAAGQSGTLGFFRERVVNVDGKVNRDALAYQDHMWDYLRQQNVRWFVDWPYYANRYLGVPLDAKTGLPAGPAHGWELRAERNYFYLYEYTGTPAR